MGNPLVVQWLRLSAFTAKDTDSNPGPGTNISRAVWGNQKKKNTGDLINNPQCGNI